MAKYHARSNVETVFSSVKRKFGGKLFMKGEIGQANEALLKILCHNLSVLTHEAHLNGLEIDFGTCTPNTAPAHGFPATETF